MFYQQRLPCQVRLLSQVRMSDGNFSPVGCGFIFSPTEVMTCTHVVTSCLGRPASAGAVVMAAFPVAEGHLARLRVREAYPTRLPSPSGDADLLLDIAILELEEGSTFPASHSIATSRLHAVEPDQKFSGTGIKKGFLKGIQIKGVTGDYAELSRVFVAAWEDDQAVKPGCSGAAVFHPTDGLLGMVAEVQQERSGLIIPIEALRKAAPIGDGSGGEIGRRPAQTLAAEPLNKLFLKEINRFDRDPQAAQFRRYFNESWTAHKSALICAIAGIEEDVPKRCRDRFRNYDLRDFFEKNNISAHKIDALEISWPQTEKRFDVDQAFATMRGELALHLNALEDDPASIRQKFNEDLRPLIFYSQLDQRTFGRRHVALLRKWKTYFCEIDDESIDRPLIHFLIVRLDSRDFRPGSDEPNAILNRFYKSMIASAQEEDGTGAPIYAASILNYFDLDFVENWIDRYGSDAGLDDDRVAEVKDDARRALSKIDYIRLKDVENWMAGLAG